MKAITKVATFLLTFIPTLAFAGSVTTYHGSLQRDGAYKIGGLTFAAAATMHRDTGFHASIGGHIYAQPLFWQPQGTKTGLVIAATESNNVYALDEDTGAIAWQAGLAPPVPLDQLPCGNIDPMGITGTPVIDPDTATLYLDAQTLTANGARRMLYALSLADGSTRPGWPIDVQAALTAQSVTFDSAHQGARGALLFFKNRLYVTYGGNSGDCQPYHGTVLQVAPATHAIEAVWQTRADRGGIWAQGGISGDGGDLFVTTGNTSGTRNWGDGEAVIRLKPGLAHSTSPKNFFAPSNWRDLDASDDDLGGTEALPFNIPVAGGSAAERLLALGKDGNAYLIDRRNLGGIGGALAIAPVSTGGIRSAPALYRTANSVMVAFSSRGSTQCPRTNVTMLDIAAGGVSPITFAWCQKIGGFGAPIVTTTDGTANPIVWAVGAEGNNLLHGFNALTGAVVFTDPGPGMAGVRHFATILATGRRFYIAADDTVYAYRFAP
ncbi:MAG TPA: hypothetical protein VHZ29_08910 [Rhizomicrobium sp.]|jgi:outer membrane protein assembly factor BamB|nr:hypothetical protein [Rhizomicrobium sp.]